MADIAFDDLIFGTGYCAIRPLALLGFDLDPAFRPVRDYV
jgi:hypothetical protein